MTDIVDGKRRSELMARIRSRDTAPELAVRRIAHRMGLRFRLYGKDPLNIPVLLLQPKHSWVSGPDRGKNELNGELRVLNANYSGTAVQRPYHIGDRNWLERSGD